MTGRAAWLPLLSGGLRESAIESARDISRALGRLSGAEEWAPSYGREIAASLATGAAGLALAFDGLEESGVVPEAAGRAEPLLDFAIETMASEEMGSALFGGFTGIGWAISRLWPASIEDPDDDPLTEVDHSVLACLEGPPGETPFDLGGGLVGLGVYALERLPRAEAAAILARIVGHLRETAISEGGLPVWRTVPEWLVPQQRVRTPAGRYDLGVAHGIPGVIGLLAQACAAGVAVDTARPLLEGSVRWLLGKQAGGGCAFPYYLEPGGARSPETRSAWCYGDPGVAAVLLMAAQCVDEPAWEREALGIALRAAALAPGETGVVDASLCHGAAGLAHLFNRMYQRTGREELRRTATAWLERTLASRRPGSGHAGYLTAVRDPQGGNRFEADPSLLSGAAGTALALAAAASTVEPAWDRMFLLSSALA